MFILREISSLIIRRVIEIVNTFDPRIQKYLAYIARNHLSIQIIEQIQLLILPITQLGSLRGICSYWNLTVN